jgi:hypothetical protein
MILWPKLQTHKPALQTCASEGKPVRSEQTVQRLQTVLQKKQIIMQVYNGNREYEKEMSLKNIGIKIENLKIKLVK